ncbi:MAG: DUF624 domain-containing protein [Cellulosilyticaceae bacterium]
MKIFDLDGPVYKVGTEITDALILTFLWIVFSIPIITVGASTSALFYIYGKKARGEDAYIWRDFIKSYKQNMIQSIPITIIIGIMWLGVYSYNMMIQTYEGGAPVILSAITLLFTLEVSVITVYVFAILSRFHLGIWNMFLTAFVLAHRHIGATAIVLATIAGVQYAGYLIPSFQFIIFLMPVLVAAISSWPIQKIFKRHIEAAEMVNQQAKEEVIDDECDDTDSEQKSDDECDDIDSEQKSNDDDDKSFLKYI